MVSVRQVEHWSLWSSSRSEQPLQNAEECLPAIPKSSSGPPRGASWVTLTSEGAQASTGAHCTCCSPQPWANGALGECISCNWCQHQSSRALSCHWILLAEPVLRTSVSAVIFVSTYDRTITTSVQRHRRNRRTTTRKQARSSVVKPAEPDL